MNKYIRIYYLFIYLPSLFGCVSLLHCSSCKPRWSLTFSWLIYRLYNHSCSTMLPNNRVSRPTNQPLFFRYKSPPKKESEEILKMPLFCSMKGPERGHQARTTRSRQPTLFHKIQLSRSNREPTHNHNETTK